MTEIYYFFYVAFSIVLEGECACSLKETTLSLDFNTKVPYLIISESEHLASILGPYSVYFIC